MNREIAEKVIQSLPDIDERWVWLGMPIIGDALADMIEERLASVWCGSGRQQMAEAAADMVREACGCCDLTVD